MNRLQTVVFWLSVVASIGLAAPAAQSASPRISISGSSATATTVSVTALARAGGAGRRIVLEQRTGQRWNKLATKTIARSSKAKVYTIKGKPNTTRPLVVRLRLTDLRGKTKVSSRQVTVRVKSTAKTTPSAAPEAPTPQVPGNTPPPPSTPTTPQPGTVFVPLSGMHHLDVGPDHSCALAVGATQPVWCWGSGLQGQLGTGQATAASRAAVATAPIPKTVLDVGAGDQFSCARTYGGTGYCWGDNTSGAGGTGSASNSPLVSPAAVTALTGADEISVGDKHACARISDGTVKCWGANTRWALGTNTPPYTAFAAIPISVSGVTSATAISSGALHTCALISGGTVSCWGANDGGTLGTAAAGSDSVSAVQISGLAGVSKIDAGSGFTCAVLTDGTVKCWGTGTSGQLGGGPKTNSATPVTVSGITGATQVSAGDKHACAVLANSTVKCWGLGSSGQLGDGTTQDRPTPVAVSQLTTVAKVSVAGSVSCALKHTGGVLCWGDGTDSRLGGASNASSSVPKTVMRASN